MGDSSTKKRKRAKVESEDPDAKLRHKIRVTENGATEAGTPGERQLKKATKDGNSKQVESERRAKKQINFLAQISPAGYDGEGAVDPKLERAHKQHYKIRSEKPDFRISAPVTDNSPPTTNGSDETRRKTMSRVPATAQTADAEIVPNEFTTDGLQPNSTSQRFILFIGNLPYSATTPQIEFHFSKLAPTSIRHSTDKSTGRSKGFAFLEFAGYDKMKTCLKLYHHSIFDPQDSKDGQKVERKDKKKPGRRINVELTVGGGGRRSEKRKEKIKGKNLKLEEERERRRVKEVEDGQKEVKNKPKNPATDANATLKPDKTTGMGDIHPSRRGRVG